MINHCKWFKLTLWLILSLLVFDNPLCLQLRKVECLKDFLTYFTCFPKDKLLASYLCSFIMQSLTPEAELASRKLPYSRQHFDPPDQSGLGDIWLYYVFIYLENERNGIWMGVLAVVLTEAGLEWWLIAQFILSLHLFQLRVSPPQMHDRSGKQIKTCLHDLASSISSLIKCNRDWFISIDLSTMPLERNVCSSESRCAQFYCLVQCLLLFQLIWIKNEFSCVDKWVKTFNGQTSSTKN